MGCWVVCWVEGVMLAMTCQVEGMVEVLMWGGPEPPPEAGRQLMVMSPVMVSPQGWLEERWDREVCSVTEVSSARQGSLVAPVASLAMEHSWAMEGCWEAVACSASSGRAVCSAPSRGSPGKDGTGGFLPGGNPCPLWGSDGVSVDAQICLGADALGQMLPGGLRFALPAAKEPLELLVEG